MLTGKEFGQAIAEAIRRKGVAKAAVARHFWIKPPSINDWINRGTVSKDKLDDLFLYFSDVCGPDHWGRSASETRRWPAHRVSEPHQQHHSRNLVQRVCDIAEKIDDKGLHTLIDMAECLARSHPLAKAKPPLLA